MAEAKFSILCPTVPRVTWCQEPWLTGNVAQYPTCCGLCPQGSVDGYGKFYAMLIGTFFNVMVVLADPTNATVYIVGQLVYTDSYALSVTFRNLMSFAPGSIHGIQRWHAEFCWLLGCNAVPIMVVAVLSEKHHLHGYETEAEHEEALAKRASSLRYAKVVVGSSGGTTSSITTQTIARSILRCSLQCISSSSGRLAGFFRPKLVQRFGKRAIVGA